MNCKQAKRNMERLVFGGLREDEAALVREHVKTCRSCQAEQARYEKLRVGLEQVREMPDVPLGAENLSIPEKPRRTASLVWIPAAFLLLAVGTALVLTHPHRSPVTVAAATKHSDAVSRPVDPPKPVARQMPIAPEHDRVAKEIRSPEVVHICQPHRLQREHQRRYIVERTSTHPTVKAASSRGWAMDIEVSDPANKRTLVLCRKVRPDGREENTEIEMTYVGAKGGNEIENNRNSSYMP